jgi:hypothetical protein
MSPVRRFELRARQVRRATIVRVVAALLSLTSAGYFVGFAQAVAPSVVVATPHPLPAGTSFTPPLPTRSIEGVDVPVLTQGSAATFDTSAPADCLVFFLSSPTFTLAGQTVDGSPYSQDFSLTWDSVRDGFQGVIPGTTSLLGQATVTVHWPCFNIGVGGFPPIGPLLSIGPGGGPSIIFTPFVETVDEAFTIIVAAPVVVVPSPTLDVTGGSFTYGQGGTFTATVAQLVPAALGAIQFKVDGVNLGSPVTLSNGSAVSPNLSSAAGFPYAVGSHGVEADYIPADATQFGSALSTAGFTVNKAASATQLALQGSSAVATVSAVAPGSGTPSGAVSFTRDGADIGTAQLSNGVATLTGLAAGAGNIAATYAGDSNFTGSSASTARDMPTIVATVTSRIAKTSYGWYRSPVTVSFTCTTTSAPLAAPCPSPVILASSGAAQSVTKTIVAQDGGTATAVTNGINIDRGRPSLWVEGVVSGRHYTSVPHVSCVGADTLSGIASCTVAVGRASHGVVHYTATATDKAGNIKTARGVYFLSR